MAASIPAHLSNLGSQQCGVLGLDKQGYTDYDFAAGRDPHANNAL